MDDPDNRRFGYERFARHGISVITEWLTGRHAGLVESSPGERASTAT